jgi:hypothetical protein
LGDWYGMRLSFAVVAVIAAIPALAPTVAFAHTSERAFVLLLPTGYYLAGGALAVAASFVILTFISAALVERIVTVRARLMRITLPDEIWTSLLAFVVLLILVAAGFAGSRDPLANPLPLTVWTLWWVGITLLHALLGNLWRWFNPWIGPFLLARRIGRGRTEGMLSYPGWLGHWPAIVAFLAFAWFELVYPAPDDPAILAKAVIGYSLVTWAGMALFGARVWLERAEAFSVFFRFVARLAPLAVGDGRLVLIFPGRNLTEGGRLNFSGILFVLLALATVSFDGLNRTFWWLGHAGINPLEFPGRSAVMALNTAGLVGSWLALAGLFFTSIWLGCRLEGAGRKAIDVAGRLALSILPISIGFQFAHYLTIFLVNGQYATIALTDPFAQGWANAHERMHGVTTSFLANADDVSVIWNLQAAGIVLGHILAVVVAHAAVLRLTKARRQVLRLQVPLAVLMVAYTLFGLWLLAAPTAG